jgi:hypothetical protein
MISGQLDLQTSNVLGFGSNFSYVCKGLGLGLWFRCLSLVSMCEEVHLFKYKN